MICSRSRVPSRAATGGLIVLLAGCGVAERRAPPPVGRIATVGALVEASDRGATLALRRPQADDAPVARLTGVRFDAGEGAVDLPFRSFTDDGVSIRFLVAGPADHDIQLEMHFEADGALRVELSDRVVTRARIAELSLAWESLVREPVVDVEVPLPHPTARLVAGDAAFRAPLAYVRQGEIALAVVPDLDQLARERVLPQALEVDRGLPAVLRHGLVAQSFVEGTARIARDASRAVTVRRETVHFAHRLIALESGPGKRPLAMIRNRIWKQLGSPRLTHRTDPLVEDGFGNLGRRILADAGERLLRRTLRGQEALLFVVDPNRSDAQQETMSFGARSNALQLALAYALGGLRRNDAEWRDLGRRIAAFALTAPNRSGLVPFGLRRRTADGREEWVPGDPTGPRPDAFSALDAATTGRLLLELARLQPENADAIRSVCFDLAHFFRDNQAADGSIPAFFEAEFLRPLPVDEIEPVAATAGPALFLAQWSAWSGDAESRDAARRAVNHLVSRALPIRAFADPARPQVDDPRSGVERIDLVPLALAARAAIELASTDPSLQEATLALLDQIAALQQVFEPPWMQFRSFGGFGASNADCTWNDGAGPLAAQALLDGYRLFGRRIDLERGVAGLRSALLEPAPFYADGRPRPDPAPFAATALVVAERTRSTLGQVVVDLSGRFALGIDAALVELIDVTDVEVRLRIATFAELNGPIALGFVHGVRTPPRVVVNGIPIALPADGFGRGIPVVPIRLPVFRFAPPREVSDSFGKVPIAEWAGRRPDAGTTTLEVAVGPAGARRTIADIPLEARDDGTLVPTASFASLGLRDGDEVFVRLVCETEGFRLVEPLRGERSVSIGTHDLIDPGDDLEWRLVDGRETSKVVRDSGGREYARQVEPGRSIAYRVATPPDTAAVELDMRVSGPIHLFGADRNAVLLREDPTLTDVSRDVAVRLADPRLWSEGSLMLRFTPAGPTPIRLASIRYRLLGNTVVTSHPESRLTPREPPPQIDLIVVPILCAGETERANESLRLAVFGGDEYRITPEPDPRPTIGSLARFVERLSGGRTSLGGVVLDPLRVVVPLNDLAAADQNARDSVAQAVRAAIDARPASHAIVPQVILAVHEGPPLTGVDGAAIGRAAGAPILLCAERSADGSFLSCGRLAQLVLGTTFGFVDLADGDQGAFGDLALISSQTGHAPSPPLGPNLLLTGWASVAEIEPGAPRSVQLAPSTAGRTLLRLSTDTLHDRGSLYIENRSRLMALVRASRDEPTGLLMFWEHDAQMTWVTELRGHTARPRILRLAPGTPAPTTPFVPGRVEDLFGSATALDEHSSPILSTLQGEVPWSLDDLRLDDTGTASFTLRSRQIDLLAGSVGFLVGQGDALAPLPADGADRGKGSVEHGDAGLSVSMPATADTLIAARFDLPRADGVLRLFGRLGPVAGGRLALRATLEGREVLAADIDANRWFMVDLPGGSAPTRRLQLEFRRLSGSPRVRLISLVAVPISGFAAQLVTRATPPRTEPDVDGVLFGGAVALAVESNRRASLRVPVVLPAARANLRLRFARPRDAKGPLSLRVELHDADRASTDRLLGTHPIEADDGESTLILQLPDGEAGRVGFVDLQLAGEAAERLLLLEMAITRG